MNFTELRGRSGFKGLVAVTGLLAFAACDDSEDSELVGIEEAPQSAVTSFEVSNLEANPGDLISLGIKIGSGEVDLGGVQGHFSWDPSALELEGQIPENGTAVITNMLADGQMHLLSVDPEGMDDRIATFAFRVQDEDWAGSLRFDPSAVVNISEVELRGVSGTYVREVADIPAARLARHMDDEAWLDEMGGLATTGVLRVAGESDVYGDGTQDNTVNVLDVLYTANISVGNTSIAECIIGSDSPDRDCVAINVRPTNGGTGSTPPPGENADGTRVVNVLDVLAIALASVGTPSAVVGDAIPNAGGGKDRGELADTVTIAGPLTITGTRDFSADTLYILQGGFMIVGEEAGAAGTINFEAGTRFEGDDASAILVSRNGTINVNGTAEAPVQFSCELPVSGVRIPSCWGGVFIAGNAVINDADAGLGAAPTIPGRNPAGGGNQKTGEGGALNYGGNNDADSSGSIRYATFSYGGAELATDNELNNLSIGACGSGTVLENIQVHAGLDDGLELFGGRCDVSGVLATANSDDQFDYSFGYDGDVQYLVIQQLGEGDKGFEVDSTEDPLLYDNQPRTGPRVYNATLIGEDLADPTQGALRYRRGAGGELRNFLIIGYDDGFDPENDVTCELIPPFTDFDGSGTASGTGTLPNVLTLDNTVFLNVDDAGDSGPSDSTEGCEAHVESYLNTVATDIGGGDELTNSEAGREYAGELKDPWSTQLPDFRPVGSGVTSADASPVAPPAGFGPGSYFGGVAPVGAGGSIPWYLGWSRGWATPTVR